MEFSVDKNDVGNDYFAEKMKGPRLFWGKKWGARERENSPQSFPVPINFAPLLIKTFDTWNTVRF